MQGLTIPRVNRWLAETLRGDATLLALGTPPLSDSGEIRVWRQAGEGTTFPRVIYQAIDDGVLLAVVGNLRVWTELTYQVKAIDAGQSAEELEAIMNRVDTLLDGANATLPGDPTIGGTATVLECLHLREREWPERDPETRVLYQNLAVEYLIRARLDE